jgi:hypothetical protein
MSGRNSKKNSATYPDEIATLMSNFQMASEHFNQDLNNFWNKANFYLLANTGLISAFYIASSPLAGTPVIYVIPVVGIAIAVLWFLVLRGTVIFIELWRNQLIFISEKIDRFLSYNIVESQVEKRHWQDPQTLTQFVPVPFIVAWLAILIVEIVQRL